MPEDPDPAGFHHPESIRAHWETVEQTMRDYLAAMQDEMLFDKPLHGEDKDLLL